MTVWKERLCTGCVDRKLRVWNKDLECVLTISLLLRPFIICLCVWMDYLVVGYRDSAIRVWSDEKDEEDDCTCVAELNGHSNLVGCLQTWNGYLCR